MEASVIKYQSAEYQSMCQLRDEVLRKPIGLRLTEEEMQKDANDVLIVCIEGEKVIGCCIFNKVDDNIGKLRQMAVKEEYRENGIGRKILQFAEKYAREHGFKTLTMHARKVALEFYKKGEYTICSEEFTEVGIPHYKMLKTITANEFAYTKTSGMNLEQLVRKNIWALKPYSSARDEFQGEASVFLDANENPYNTPYDRYPDPKQWEVKDRIANLKSVRKEKIFLGNGSDEPIDLIIRIFCEPRTDNIVAIDPTYGMYRVAANTNDVEYREVLLDESFNFQAKRLLEATDENTKVIFLCSPNNPTGNSLDTDEIIQVLNQFKGIVVVDEAYIDFSTIPSLLNVLDNYPNLIVLQTFSKAWASAGVRLGMAFASEKIIAIFNKVKYPYNVNMLTQDYALRIMNDYPRIKDWINVLLKERAVLEKELKKLVCVEKVYPSNANFLLVKVKNANATYQYLIDRGIVTRNRNNISLCLNCVRITVGTKAENQMLIETLKMLKS